MHYGEHWASNQTVHITFSLTYIARGKLKKHLAFIELQLQVYVIISQHMRSIDIPMVIVVGSTGRGDLPGAKIIGSTGSIESYNIHRVA